MSKVAAAKPCAGCGHTEFTRDFSATAGDILCSQCGMVQIENPIVSEVQFGESSSGAATVQGAMVGADQARVYNMRNSLESREQTLMNAKSKIKLLAAAMRIPDYIHESACGWFKLALVQNFVQGRRSQNVIAACLYVACRHEKTPHLLIDFSSRLQISVYSLGATYLKLVRALQIQRLPLADPSLFIQHFAERLDFKEHTAKVCRDATKIAQRMSSDWIYEGRRPAGIAGACLLLAARMNNFRRTHAEIVAVAKVGEETLQKRLNEFKKTSSASLSVSEFRDSAHTNDSQPPSFQKNRAIEMKIEKLLRQRKNTLKKYKELAQKRELFKHLKLNSDGSVMEGESTETQEKETGNEGVIGADNGKENESIDKDPKDSFGVAQGGDSTEPTEVQNPQETRNSQSDAQESTQPVTGTEKVKDTQIAVPETAPDSLKDTQSVPEAPSNPPTQTDSSTSNEKDVQNEEPQSETQHETQNELQKDKQKDGPANPATTSAITDTPAQIEEDSVPDKVASAEEEGINPIFVPASDDEDGYGYDALPDNADDADEDYEQHHKKIVESRKRALRPSTLKASAKLPKPKKKSSRLGSIANSRRTIRTAPPKPKKVVPVRQKKDEEELKRQKEQQKAEEKEALEDEFLKAVLTGGDIKEEDLEIALDKILQGQTRTLASSLYRTPAELQNETDLLKQIDWDRPRNLVLNNPTTSQILARVPDDETIHSGDEDDEVRDVQLTDEERQQKERIWIALNHDFLIAQERKRLKIEADELTGNTSGQPRKRRKIKEADPLLDDAAVANAIHSIGEGGRMITPAENAKQMLQKKSFSRKINYSSIGDLFNE